MWWTRLGVSWTLNSSQPSLRKNIIAISIVTTLYLMSWQFAQFTLFTQVTVLRGLHLLELVPRKEAVEAVLRGLLVNTTLIYYECRLWRHSFNSKVHHALDCTIKKKREKAVVPSWYLKLFLKISPDTCNGTFETLCNMAIPVVEFHVQGYKIE